MKGRGADVSDHSLSRSVSRSPPSVLAECASKSQIPECNEEKIDEYHT